MTDAIRDDSNLNSVKGGLIGLASCGIGVGTDIINYISLLLPPVLDCFDSEDTQVRFYACESLYNIVKAGNLDVYQRNLQQSVRALRRCRRGGEGDILVPFKLRP